MPDFIPGRRLTRAFYLDAVKPVLNANLPDLQFSAALIGSGSEVLGFDTEMSTDHHWGPRVMLFLREADYSNFHKVIDEALRHELPLRFQGYSTNFTPPDPADNSVQLLQDVDNGPINHRVEILTIRGFFLSYLNFDIEEFIEAADWLTFPEQKLLTIIAGEVYHDGVGLQPVRSKFSYYPYDVWLYLLASGWNRIGQEEHLMGRAGMVGDEIGSAIIGARLVRDAMRLCFLMEKQYAPYAKWFGTAFLRLRCAKDLSPTLTKVLSAETWQEREKHLATAYEYIAKMHNQLGITEALPSKVTNFFGRPFQVIHTGGGFAGAISSRIKDPAVKRIADRKLIGSVDQFSDSTDITSDPQWRLTLRRLYE
jgi:hypothetical protein